MYIVTPDELADPAKDNINALMQLKRNAVEVKSSLLRSKARMRLIGVSDEINRILQQSANKIQNYNYQSSTEEKENESKMSQHDSIKAIISKCHEKNLYPEMLDFYILHQTDNDCLIHTTLVERAPLGCCIKYDKQSAPSFNKFMKSSGEHAKDYEHNVVIISGHGFGFSAGNLPKLCGLTSSQGLSTKDVINGVKLFKQKSNKKINILVMDACLMQSVGVCAGITDYVNYYLASQNMVHGKGLFDYKEAFLALIDRKEYTEVNIINTMMANLTQQNKTRDVTCINLKCFKGYIKEFNDFAESLLKACSSEKIQGMIKQAKHYSDNKEASHRTDVLSFLTKVKNFSEHNFEVKFKLMRVLENLILLTNGIIFKRSKNNSLTIYTGVVNNEIKQLLKELGLRNWAMLLEIIYSRHQASKKYKKMTIL